MSSSHQKLSKLKQINLFVRNSNKNKDQDESMSRTASSTGIGSRFGQCPLCEGFLPLYKLEMHAATCTGECPRTSNATTNAVANSSKDWTVRATTKSSSKRPGGDWSVFFSDHSSKKKARDDSKLFPVADPSTTQQDGLTNENLNVATSLVLSRPEMTIQTMKIPATIFNPIKSISNTRHHHQQELLPPGLFFYPDFISVEEEDQLLQWLDDPKELPGWKMGRFNGHHAGKRWGVHCNLRDRRVEAPEHPLPLPLQQIVFSKLSHLSCWRVLATRRGPKFRSFHPNEANAIDYRRQRGDWLQAHVDDRKLSTEPIANLSLAGDCIMTFGDDPSFRVNLPRRGLQILTGPARYNYTHAIANSDLLSDRRVSITMRESPPTIMVKTTPTNRHEP